MFGWFAPRCPLGTWEKAWTETRLCWLADKLGIDRLLRAEVLLPTEQHFPDPYQGTVEDAQRIMVRLCGLMGLDPERVVLKVHDDEALPGAAGTYERPRRGDKNLLRVARSQLEEPMALVATLAHELAHEILLGGNLLDHAFPDHEWITDLVPVYLGLGIFAANSTLREQSNQEGVVSWWTMSRQGYLPSRIFGYAMALFAWVRGEKRPPWAKHLRRDASAALKQGLRYLEESNDSLFRPETVRLPPVPPSGAEVVHRLRTGSPGVRLASLWDVEQRGLTTPECLDAVTACLEAPDPTVVGEAARMLPLFGPAAGGAVPALIGLLKSSSEEVQAGAASALGELGGANEKAAPEVGFLVRDAASRQVLIAGAGALARLHSPLDERSIAHLLGRLKGALIECDDPLVEALTAALIATSPIPERSVDAFFRGGDEDLRQQALTFLLKRTPPSQAGEGGGDRGRS